MKNDNALTIFKSAEFGSVRAMLIDGEPWFVGKDVATALGYSNSRKALKDHVPDKYKKADVTIRDVSSNGVEQRRNVTLINEAGLYKLVMRSELESAEEFSDWVCEGVLPSIRKTGSYSIQDDPRWLETRNNTKASHKPFTYAIKLMLDYLKQFGEYHKEGYVYGHITNIVQNACGIIRGQRDSSPVANLNKCDLCQNMVATLILNVIAQRQAQSLSEFVSIILSQLNNLNNLLGGMPVALLPI